MKGKFLSLLQALYLGNSMELKIGDNRSGHFPVSNGLRQGCVLSPLLFSLYINGLIMELKLKKYGVVCGGLLLPELLFADDTSLFGEDVEGLEQSLIVLEEWCTGWGMKINAEKSAIIHFRRKSCPQCDQLRAFRSYCGVPRTHLRTSLFAEIEVLSVGWEARIRHILFFWHRILADQRYQHCLIWRLACAALTAPGRGQWMGKLRTCLVGMTTAVLLWLGCQGDNSGRW